MRGEFGAGTALCRGVHAVDWGLPADEPVVPGMIWRWQGAAWRLDQGTEALWLGRPLARGDMRPRARSRMRRLSRAPQPALAEDTVTTEAAPPGGLVLTDGLRLYPARLVRVAARMTLVFDPWLPPPDTDLWVTALDSAPAPKRRAALGGLVAGARVDTPDGPRPVETLAPGDLVTTRDHGARALVWCGQTRLSGAELALHPHLRPLLILSGALGAGRPERPLRLAPGHRLMVPGLPGLSPQSEALAAAADIEDGRRIRRDLGCGSVTYVHLMLDGHEVIEADGVACESFHPALADPVALRWHARGIERAVPGLTTAPHRFGEPARRCLTTAEAALLAAA